MPRAAYRTELGTGWVRFDDRGIVEIRLPSVNGGERSDPTPPRRVERLVEALEAFYDGRASLLVPDDMIDAAGATPMLRDVYRCVSGIRPGHTMTYGEVAAAVGHPRAARAVGAAMARNPFAPVIPCHRVVGGDGRLHGYGGGLHQKEALLRMEHDQAADLPGERGRLQLELGVGDG